MRLHQTKKLLHNEGNQQNEKVNHWMEKIFANHISSKKLISQIYREAIQLNNNKTWLKNEQRIWIDIFPKQTHRWPTNIWKDDQHHELLGKHKSKPQWHIILHLLQWLLLKRQRLTNVGKGCGKEGTLIYCWWDCKLGQSLCKTVWRVLKKLRIELSYDPAIPLLDIYLKKMKTLVGKDICTRMFTAALFMTAKITEIT